MAAQSSSAEGALRSAGIRPLESKPLVAAIRDIANKPGYAANDLIEGATSNVAEAIKKYTEAGGVIDAYRLDAIRKNAVDATIAKLRPSLDATAQRNAAAGVMSNLKPLIDDAIKNAGGGDDWAKYLATHSKGMQEIAKKKLTGEALKLYNQTNKDAFVNLVKNESPEVVEKFLGPGNYNIGVALADDTMQVLRKKADEHLARMASRQQASDGQRALATLVMQNTSRLRFPSLVNAWAATGNRVLSELETRLGTKTTAALSKAMQDPKTAANLLEYLPPSDRNKFIKLLNNPPKAVQQGAGTTTRTVINSLAPESENQNALVD
jgi:hypothetical protein